MAPALGSAPRPSRESLRKRLAAEANDGGSSTALSATGNATTLQEAGDAKEDDKGRRKTIQTVCEIYIAALQIRPR